jgi:hypothetical protein
MDKFRHLNWRNGISSGEALISGVKFPTAVILKIKAPEEKNRPNSNTPLIFNT